MITNNLRIEVLCKLYNNSYPQEMGWFQYIPGDLSQKDASKLLAKCEYFDYLHGRVLKIKIPRNLQSLKDLNFRLYNRDNGEGKAEAALGITT